MIEAGGGEALVLGLDVGGTKIAGGLVDADGVIMHRSTEPTARDGRRDPGLATSYRLAAQLLADARSRDWSVTGLGIGVPEYVTADGELSSRLVLEWDRQPREQFADLGPVTVESDVRCGALAEAVVGAGRGFASVLYVTVGTGLSSSLVAGGVVLPGARGEAIAFGELPVARAAAADESGSLEEFASGAGIADRYRAGGGGPVDGAAQVVTLADDGDPLAQNVVNSAARAVGTAISWMVAVLDPAVVVLGAGWARAAGAGTTRFGPSTAAGPPSARHRPHWSRHGSGRTRA